jgi:hypothetical protein
MSPTQQPAHDQLEKVYQDYRAKITAAEAAGEDLTPLYDELRNWQQKTGFGEGGYLPVDANGDPE